MGSLTNNAGALAAFTGQPFPNGLDLGRCVIQQDLGIFTANPNAIFLAGMLVTKTAAGIEAADGSNAAHNVLGIAKWNKAKTLYSVVIDEPVVFKGAASTVTLKHATVSNVAVSVAAGGAPVANAASADWTANLTNGIVTAVAAGLLVATNPQTAYVTYTYAITEADLDFQGRNFWNFTDDVSIQDNHITVLTDWSICFTTQYDTSVDYALGDSLYAGQGAKAGLFCKTSNANSGVVAKVFQAPTASDPFLGVIFG